MQFDFVGIFFIRYILLCIDLVSSMVYIKMVNKYIITVLHYHQLPLTNKISYLTSYICKSCTLVPALSFSRLAQLCNWRQLISSCHMPISFSSSPEPTFFTELNQCCLVQTTCGNASFYYCVIIKAIQFIPKLHSLLI